MSPVIPNGPPSDGPESNGLGASPQSPNPRPASSHDRQRCADYLLGEMAPEDAAHFEQRLAASPDLNRELLIQSEVICGIDATPSLYPATLASQDARVRSPDTLSFRRLITIVSALAACLMLAVFAGRSLILRDNGPDRVASAEPAEALLIAQTWATQNDDSDAEESWQLLESESDLAESDLAWEESVDDDSSLSWMVVAIAADAQSDSDPSRATSDG